MEGFGIKISVCELQNLLFNQISSRRSSNDEDDDDFEGENLFETLKNKDEAPTSRRNLTKREDLNLFLKNLDSIDKSVDNKEAVMRSFFDGAKNPEPDNDDFQFKDSLDFKLIDPVKDDKLFQLQAANENLRRELSMSAIEVASIASSSKPSVADNLANNNLAAIRDSTRKADQQTPAPRQSMPVRAKNINEMMHEYNTLQRIKKSIAATKIQTWYKRRLYQRKNQDYRNQLTK